MFHIAHVVTRLLRAGSEENVVSTCLGHLERGHRVSLIHGRDADEDFRASLPGEIRLVRVEDLVQPIAPLADLRATRALAGLFREIQPDLVHTHQSKAGVLGRVGARIAGAPRIVHGVHIAPFLNVGAAERAAYVAAERMAARFTDAFISVSAGMRDAYLEAGIGDADRHHVVHSGMPLDEFIGARPPDDWRDLAGVADDAPRPPIVLMVAAMEPRKRHRELIEVFGQVVEHIPDVRLLFAGDGPARPAVEAAVAEAGLQQNIRLLGHHPQPGQLVALADLCLLTSLREGLPRVVVQYIAGGKPVVVTHVKGIEEAVRHGVSGIVTDPDNLSDTAGAIIALLTDEALRSRLAAGAAATDVSSWRPEALVEGTERIYASLLDPAASARGALAAAPDERGHGVIVDRKVGGA